MKSDNAMLRHRVYHFKSHVDSTVYIPDIVLALFTYVYTYV